MFNGNAGKLEMVFTLEILTDSKDNLMSKILLEKKSGFNTFLVSVVEI